MAKVLMIQGTMSGAGKSLLTAGLCRIFKQDGYKTAPFKSQNMALNSYVTDEGLEMGRAQVMQAEAAGVRPMVQMNPVLLKPTGDKGSQVIVNGEVTGNVSAKNYYKFRQELIPKVMEAYHTLEREYDIIVIEGAGSPVEINLKKDDFVNMGLARLVQAPVLLAGDIDRGGVFAQLLGTQMLLEEDEKKLLKGFIVNKFRGDLSLFDSGVNMLEEKGETKVVGVVPFMDINLEEEDSVSRRIEKKQISGAIDIAVIKLPRISNYTDFQPLENISQVSLRYIERGRELGNPDLIILPGTKNTIADLRWMRDNGLEVLVKKQVEKDVPIFGICGGLQMLGEELSDPHGVEGGGQISGMGLLPLKTVFGKEKTRQKVHICLGEINGIFSKISHKYAEGYEIHMGKSDEQNRYVYNEKNIYGTYLHGIFDKADIAGEVIQALCERKGILFESEGVMDYLAYKETQYDLLADHLRRHLDIEEIYNILNRGI